MNKLIIESVLELKEQGYDVIQMNHAFRINGCVDIFNNGKTVYNKNENEYTKYNTVNESIEFALLIANKNGKQKAFKSAKSGRMSLQQFKHMKKLVTAEYYHWNNNLDETSEDHLYFIKSSLYIKIGRSKNVKNRLKQLQTGMPEDAELLHIEKNKGCLEHKMHLSFSELKTKSRGEWFVDSKRIRKFIKFLKEN